MPTWLSAIRRYTALALAGHLVWEVAHLPFYTLWLEAEDSELAFAVVHCTVGDVFIALCSLVGALVVAGGSGWPSDRFVPVAWVTVFSGIAYTVYSEWLNVTVRGEWAYAESMPTVPPFDTGLTPVLQWVLIPALALGAVQRASRASGQ